MDVLMPQLGETVAEGKISKWFVAAGDAVKPGDNLFEIETDKVSMEVPAIAAGTLASIHVQAGEVAPVGAVVAVIHGKGEAISASTPPPPPTPAKAGVQSKELGPRFRGDERAREAAVTKSAIPMEPFREVRSPERNYGPARLPGGTVVTPLARRLAGEAGIDLANIKGSGPHGRIVAADIAMARSTTTPALAPAHAAATVVLTADVQITDALALRDEANAALEKNGKRLLALADVIVKAWAVALVRTMPAEQPDVFLAIGKSGLLFRNAAQMPLTAISAVGASVEAHNASTAVSISAAEGVTSVIDALRPPQTTLLSIGATRRAPVEAPDGAVKFVSMITATLVCDPRAVDAALGAELLSAFKGFVEKPVTMIV